MLPQHSYAFQLRAACNRGRNPRLGAAVRPQAERLHAPSKANEPAFERAVDEVAESRAAADRFHFERRPPRATGRSRPRSAGAGARERIRRLG